LYSCTSSSSLSDAGPCLNVTVSTISRQFYLSYNCRHVVLNPVLRTPRTFSTVWVQVCCGRPGGLLQWHGKPIMPYLSALVWSIPLSGLAMFPNNQRHLFWRRPESCQDCQVGATLGMQYVQKSVSTTYGMHPVFTRGFWPLFKFLHCTGELEDHANLACGLSNRVLECHMKHCRDLTHSHANAMRRQTSHYPRRRRR